MAGYDTNIILGGRMPEIQPASNSLFKAMKLRAMQGELQAQEAQAQQQQRAFENNELRRRILAEGGGEAELMRGGFTEDAIKIGEHKRKSQETDAKTAVQQLEATARRFGLVQTVANGINSPESWALGRMLLEKEKIPVDALGQAYDPKTIEDLRLQAVTKNDEIQHALRQAQFEQTGRRDQANADNQRGLLAVSQQNSRIAGGHLKVAQDRLTFDQTNPTGTPLDTANGPVMVRRDGTATPVTVGGAPVPAKPVALTEVQGNATNFASRMTQAEKILGELEAKGVNSSTAGAIAAKSKWTNWLATSEGQQYMQGARNWVTANLRKESGAAIPPAELDAEVEKYFPVVGDKPDNIEQKRQARAVAREGMLVQAGPGAKQVEGIVQRGSAAQASPGAPAVGTVKRGYRFKGGDPSNQENWEKV